MLGGNQLELCLSAAAASQMSTTLAKSALLRGHFHFLSTDFLGPILMRTNRGLNVVCKFYSVRSKH